MPDIKASPSVEVNYEPRHLDLPDLPSDLLSMALQDLCAVEQSTQEYAIDMTKWHVPGRGVCYVCLAGALLTRFLEMDELVHHPQGRFDDVTFQKLGAVDLFRCGSLRSGVRFMGLPVPPGLCDMEVTAYDEDPSSFRTCIAMASQELKRVGL
jgi:hypothetical protein